MSAQPAEKPRIYKLRGTVVEIDLVTNTITIQPSEHDGKRLRRLTVTPESEILAGKEHKTLAEVMVGDWVKVYLVIEGERSLLKRLHIPRSLDSIPPLRTEATSPLDHTTSDSHREGTA